MPTPVLIKPTTRQLAEATSEARRTARIGLDAEHNVRNYLRSIGHPTVDSTRYEDRMLDIDCRHAVSRKGISIKMQNKGVHTGNLCFETKRFNMRAAFDYHEVYYSTDDPLYGALEAENHDKFWEPSWYEYGKADWYIIGVGERLYKAHVPLLKEYVDTNGWLDYKDNLTPSLRIEHYGRKYTNYQVGLLKIDTLLEARIMLPIK